MVTGHWYTNDPNFGALSWFWRWKEHPCPLSPDLGLWRMLEVTDWGLASWYWYGYGHWSLVQPYSEFWLSSLILKVQRTSMSFKSWFGALEDAGGSWLGSWLWFINGYAQADMSWCFHLPQGSFSSDICSAQLRKYDASGQAVGWEGGRVRWGSAKIMDQPFAN